MALNDFGKKIRQTGQDTFQKGKNATESMKIKSRITDLEKTITSVYTDIGRIYVSRYAENVPDEEMVPYFQKIASCTREIQECNEQIRVLKGISLCPNCGGEVSTNAAFCNHCGERLVPVIPESANRCPSCGEPIENGALFCTGCGYRLQPAEMPPKEEEKRHCTRCGAELDENALFCVICGTRVEDADQASQPDLRQQESPAPENSQQESPAPENSQHEKVVFDDADSISQEEIPEGVFKRRIGNAAVREEVSAGFCVNCGAPLGAGEIFCSNCGTRRE